MFRGKAQPCLAVFGPVHITAQHKSFEAKSRDGLLGKARPETQPRSALPAIFKNSRGEEVATLSHTSPGPEIAHEIANRNQARKP